MIQAKKEKSHYIAGQATGKADADTEPTEAMRTRGLQWWRDAQNMHPRRKVTQHKRQNRVATIENKRKAAALWNKSFVMATWKTAE